VLAASLRSVAHVRACAELGADAVTVPPSVLMALLDHPLTTRGLQTFEADWRATGQVLPD
jgi:transaldolase